MKVSIKIEKEVDLKKMYVEAFVGDDYWEDAVVDDVRDIDGSLIPGRKGDWWCPVIDLDTGMIDNWEKGKKASIHYKVRDRCSWWFEDADKSRYGRLTNEYVPKILCPAGPGYGDYIIMEIDESGKIQGFDASRVKKLFSE